MLIFSLQEKRYKKNAVNGIDNDHAVLDADLVRL